MDLIDFSVYIITIIAICVSFLGSQIFSVSYIQAMGRFPYSILAKVGEYLFLFLTLFLGSFLIKFNGFIYYTIDLLIFGLCAWVFVYHRQTSRAILAKRFHKSAENKVNREVRRTILLVRESTYSDN